MKGVIRFKNTIPGGNKCACYIELNVIGMCVLIVIGQLIFMQCW